MKNGVPSRSSHKLAKIGVRCVGRLCSIAKVFLDRASGFAQLTEFLDIFMIQVSKEFLRAVNVLRSSVQLLVLPPTLSASGLEGMVNFLFLGRIKVIADPKFECICRFC